MYAGHAAIALIFKAKAPEVPLVPLVLASYGPDLLELAMLFPHPRGGTGIYTHSLLAVLIGAVGGGLLYNKLARRSGALLIAAAWVSHIGADLFTGLKPLVVSDHLSGLDLYHLTAADAVVECALVVVATFLYARAIAKTRPQRRIAFALGIFLVLLQAEFDVVLPRLDSLPWNPSLAFVGVGAQFPSAQLASADGRSSPHASCI